MPSLLRLGFARSGSRDAARDVVQEVYLTIRQGRRKWNPAVEPSLAAYACGVLVSLLNHRRASARERRETGLAGGTYEDAPTSHPNPEQLNVMKQDHALYDALLDTLVTDFADDPVALGVIRCADEGTTDPADQAERLGAPIAAIYNARRRVRYAVERLRTRPRAGAARVVDTEGT